MNARGAHASTPSGGAPVLLGDDDTEPDEDDTGPDAFDIHNRLQVVGHGWIVQPKHSIFVGSESVVAHADVDSLRDAMLQERCCAQLPGSPEWVAIATDGADDFHPESSPLDTVHLLVDTDRVSAVAEVMMRREPQWRVEDLKGLLRPAVAPHGCVIDKVEYLVGGIDPDTVPEQFTDFEEFGISGADERDAWRARPHQVRVFIRNAAPTTVGVLLAAGRDVQAMLEALKDGPLNVRTSRNLLLAGLPRLLCGLPENEWLEVKSRGYQLGAPSPTGERAKIELAQDVARFANGDCDAMLVIGFEESTANGSAKLGAVRPVSLNDIDVDRYRKVIDGRVVPPVEGLTIERVDLGNNHGLLIISVPRQPPELQPYLVHGAIAGERTEGAFISIVRRRGEGSITISAQQIHAYIVAGRAYLRAHGADHEG